MANSKKVSTKYVCSECGGVTPQWLGRCPSCGKFATIIEEIDVIKSSPKKEQTFSRQYEKAKPISQVSDTKLVRISSSIKEFDRVLGGGIVPSSLVLIGGDPGIGKSTLMTMVAGTLADNHKVLYASAEESCSQVKIRCKRLNTSQNIMIMNENCLENIIDEAEGYDFLILDSIQAVYLNELNSSAGSVGQVKECASRLMQLAKGSNITIFIIGHVTKDGNIAGPKVLEHIMDTVLYFEGQAQDNYKLLRAVKNRFGSAQEVGVFEMLEDGIHGVTDYNGIFVSNSQTEYHGSVVTPYLSGNRCMLVEIQTLLCKTVFGMPRRMPLGIDYNKLVLMLAVLEKKGYIPLYNSDVYINAMGGMKLDEPSCDLAIVMALASSAKEVCIPKGTCIFGEVGLSGEIRPVTNPQKRVIEAINNNFKRVIFPSRNNKNMDTYKDKIELIPVGNVYSAIKLLTQNKDDNAND